MIRKIFALSFSIFLLLSQPVFLFGQTVAGERSDWTAVQSLRSGAKIAVETKDGRRLKGKLNAASPTELSLTGEGKTAQLNRDEVKKIYQLISGGSRAKAALIGAALGAGTGAGASAIALGSSGGSDDTSGIVGKGVLIGAGIGLVVGLLVGRSGKRVLVYESR